MLQGLIVNIRRGATVALAVTILIAARGEEPSAPALPAGSYAGPALWRVSKGEHELWLYGTLSVVPKEMKWSSAAVEDVIGEAQEVLMPPGVNASTLKPVQLVRVWLRVREMSASPGGKPLADVLPADLYQRYSTLRDRYMRRERGLEELRPIVVVARVYQGAVEQMGLISGREVQSGIERVARRAGVETTETKLRADPNVLLDQASLVTSQAELDCFAKVLVIMEADDRRSAARAHAWALGDVAALRSFEYPDIQHDCVSLPGWPEALRATLREANDKWLDEAERALGANRTTFATLDIRELISADGLLAQLGERGYEVQGP